MTPTWKLKIREMKYVPTQEAMFSRGISYWHAQDRLLQFGKRLSLHRTNISKVISHYFKSELFQFDQKLQQFRPKKNERNERNKNDILRHFPWKKVVSEEALSFGITSVKKVFFNWLTFL